jgi:hypothetical protein
LDLEKNDKKLFIGKGRVEPKKKKKKPKNQIGPTCVVSTWIGTMKNW